MEGLIMQLNSLGIYCRRGLPLSRRSSFRIGGSADLGIFPSSCEQLILVLRALDAQRIPHTTVGKGSNILFSDDGYRGALVFTEGVCEVSRDQTTITAAAGVSVTALSRIACEASLSGLEFACGIPGTLGGAVYMNAGAYGGEIADVCVKTVYYDPQDGAVHTLSADAQGFDYRTSLFQKHPEYTILSAELKLCEGDRDEIAAKMEELLARRREKQPLELPSAGSSFKRPTGHYAGKLIEDCGLKGLTVGGAQVSPKHAGFIVNIGGATAKDVRTLISLIQERVKERFDILLEPEIRFL